MRHKTITLVLLILVPTILLAHGSHGNGVLAGFTHPILGVDHNIAILGSGLLGYILNKKNWYFAPLAFISAMVIGGFLGVNNEATLFVEKTIAFSVFSTGFIIAFRTKLNLLLILILLAIFGCFHGYAHGAEMAETNTVFKYIPGYTLGAILLACLGAFVGKIIHTRKNAYTMISGIIIGCGIMMLLP